MTITFESNGKTGTHIRLKVFRDGERVGEIHRPPRGHSGSAWEVRGIAGRIMTRTPTLDEARTACSTIVWPTREEAFGLARDRAIDKRLRVHTAERSLELYKAAQRVMHVLKPGPFPFLDPEEPMKAGYELEKLLHEIDGKVLDARVKSFNAGILTAGHIPEEGE